MNLLAAVFFALKFTAPGDLSPGTSVPVAVASYEAERRAPSGPWSAAPIYAGPGATFGAPTPRAPGLRDSVWTSITNDAATWIAGGLEFRLRSVDLEGNRSPWSNYVVAVAGPDTLWTCSGARLLDPWAKRGTFAAFARAPRDTSAGVRAEHFETVQRRERARICALFGFWALKGARSTCP